MPKRGLFGDGARQPGRDERGARDDAPAGRWRHRASKGTHRLSCPRAIRRREASVQALATREPGPTGGVSPARGRAFRCRSGMRASWGPTWPGLGCHAIVPGGPAGASRTSAPPAARRAPRHRVQGGHCDFAVAAARLPSTPARAVWTSTDRSIGRRGEARALSLVVDSWVLIGLAAA
jgi:hypothetical protein